MAVLGLRFCARAFSSCGKWGPLFIAVHGPLTIAASLVAEHRLQTRRLSNCGSRAQLLRGMWNLPRSGLEPASPALAGRFSTTAPPGKPNIIVLRKFPSVWTLTRNVKECLSYSKLMGKMNFHYWFDLHFWLMYMSILHVCRTFVFLFFTRVLGPF